MQAMERGQRDLLSILAYFYLCHDRPEKAAVLYALLDVVAPDDPPTLKGQAVALMQDGKPDQALAVLDRLSSLGSGGASMHLLRSQALRATGDIVAAEAAFDLYLAARASA